MSQRLRDVVIGLVSVVWAVNVSAPLFMKGFQSSAEINAVFMAIVGVYFGTRAKDTEGNSKNDDKAGAE